MDYPATRMETRFEELKRYVRFTDDDARRLAALRDVAAPHFERIVQEFYERIREHEEAHAVLIDEAQVVRLQRSLVVWLERVLGGQYDERYFEKTAQIGRVHVKVGLPQRYMFTAMALIRASLSAIASAETRESLSRILDLELAIMVDSYREDMVARLEHLAQAEREVLSRRALRAEERSLSAVELVDTMIIGLSSDGKILLFNKEAERVTGYARDEALGRELNELSLPPELVEVTGEDAEVALRTRSGNERDVRFRTVRLPANEDGAELFAMGHDVTDERAANQRAKLHERLAAVGTLAAGLAHEIRNPLNGAQLHVSFLERALKKAGADAEALEAVATVRDEIKRLANLVTDFLDFARPRPLALAETSVRALCERALSLVSHEASTTVSLQLDLPVADIVLEADCDRLEQVLLNLLINAVEAVAPRGGTVILRARRRPRHAVIEVEDDGPGLPPSGAPIFDAFFSTKPNGTGLGLAIAHRVVTDHGGTIDVESQRGKTRFRILLPLPTGGPST
jgi:PAS domain S-box-containing protein